MSGRIPAKGCDRPALKHLNKYVRKGVSVKWHDLGLELLEQEDEEMLYEIKTNHSNDVSECCKEMFRLWLRKCTNATWDQLIQALRDVDLNSVATTIVEILNPTEDTVLYPNADTQPQLQLISHQGQAMVQSTDRESDQSVMKSTDIHGSEDNYEINFEEFENVSSAFSTLFRIFQEVISDLSNSKFQIIKTVCIAQANKPLRNLLESASDSYYFFQVLATNNMYCNWIRIDFLEIIAHAHVNRHVNRQLVNLIKNYKKVIFSKPLHKVWSSLQHYSVRNKYYSELKATFDDKDPDNVTIDELFKKLPHLAKKIERIFAAVQKGSLIVHWLIPTDKLYKVYLSFLTVPQQTRMDKLLEFGNWIAYLPQSVLVEEQKSFGTVSNSVLLIGYYHGLLLRDTDADLLVADMLSAELLSVQEQNIILSGHTLHHRNWLLLEHVRHLDSESLEVFSRLVQDMWPQIGLQLATALISDEVISADKVESTAHKQMVECKTVYNVQSSYIKTASVLTSFFQVVDLIGELLQYYDVQILVNYCKCLMASNKRNIILFSNDQIQKFSECSTTLLLLQMLSSFFTWSNHSTLRALVDQCSEAVNILDDFDLRLDPLQLIAYYPVPCFSVNMIPKPSDTSTYTILAVRCKVELYESSLQYVYDVQSVMIEKCDITQHCLQLLAVRSDPTILYWTIPQCVVHLIKTSVPLHSEYLYSRGMMEMVVYPDLLLTTSDDVCYGALAFECRDPLFGEEYSKENMSGLWSLVRDKSSQDLWDSAKFALIKDVDIIKNEIGRGSFGVVYGAVYGGTQCVAKEIHSNLIGGGVDDNAVLKSFIKEINILSTLRHSNIVYFYGVHFREGSHVPVMIMERMWTSLAKVLGEQPSIPLVIKVHVLHDVACGLKFLHSQDPPVIHRDLTANNILVNKNMDAKITDLGLATALEAITKQRMSIALGNLAHMPPEALQHNTMYSTKLDIFSFGCVSLHTITEQFPTPTDQFESSQMSKGTFLKISELRRRQKYIDIMQEHCPQLFQLVSWCLKDIPEYRPDANQLCIWIKEYQKTAEVKQNCTDLVIEYCQQDKLSLVTALNEQSTKAEDLDSTVKMYQSQVQELTNSAVSKDEQISSLQRHNNDLQRSMQSQQLENEQLRSQTEKIQQDLSQHTDNEIIMSLNTMLQQEQEDIREKQEEIKELKMRLNNLEQDSMRMRREGERKEQEGNTLLEALRKREAELSSNIEVINNEKKHLTDDKEGLERDVQSYCANLQDEIKDLKTKLEKLERTNKSLQSENVKKQVEESLSDDEQLNASNENENFRQAGGHSDPTNINKMQKLKEVLKLKLKHEEKMLAKETAEKKEKFKKEAAYWKAKAEQMGPLTDKDLEAKLLAERKNLEQEKEKLKQQSLAAHQMNTKHLTEFHNSIKEMQAAHESHMQKEKQKFQYLETLKHQEEQYAKLKQEYANAKSSLKRQLVEKSLRLSLLQPHLNSCQQKLDNKDKELSEVLQEKESIQKLLESMSKLHTSAHNELKTYKEAHKKEANILENITAENVNEVLQAELSKCQDLIGEKQKEITLLKETLQSYHDSHSVYQNKIKELEKQVKDITRSQTKLERQYETKFKQNSKYIETLEKKTFSEYSSHYRYSISWSPYMSLAVKRIRPCAAIVKDKLFVTGGYYQVNPHGEEVKTFLKSLEGNSEVYCFYMGKYQCDAIASPVMLGALASVNGQCVLVSGADSVGSTLTGNVYVLCEEGSHDQWKEFSKPLPTPRILACACCYDNRWLIVCGGFSLKLKEGYSLLEAVNVMEILDTTKGEWYTLPDEKSPNFSTILCCLVVGEEVYVVGSDQVIKTSCSNLMKAAASSNTLVWDKVQIETEDSDVKFYPFSVVEVNGKPMIIASMTDGEDDVTCVLMKDTRGRWRIMSKAVECQHCSAAAVTSSLELLLFGGSEKISVEEATEICQNGTLIPTTSDVFEKDDKFSFPDNNASESEVVVPNQPPNLSFTGPIHTIQFDHNGGTFQSPIHKVSLVVPPNALSDGEKVTVYMGATTSGPFDLPEDCKLRSAVVWLSISPSDVVFKRSILAIVPHSAVFASSQHRSMMRFITCEDYKGPRYSFSCSLSQYEIDREQGVIELNEFAMVAIIASPEFTHDPEDEGVAEGFDSDDDFQDALEDVESLGTSDEMVASTNLVHYQETYPKTVPPACFLAKIFWPRGELPRCFRADIYYILNLPTELYKVDTLYKKQYYEENGAYPEIVDTEFILNTDKVKCLLPCHGSSKCDCLRDWDVIQMSDASELQINEEQVLQQHHSSQSKFSLKFTCDSGAPLTCCFEFQGAKRLRKTSSVDLVPPCLQKHFTDSTTPFIMERGISHHCQIAVPIIEPVEKTHAHEIVHDNSHEVVVSNARQGVMTDTPPLKNLL